MNTSQLLRVALRSTEGARLVLGCDFSLRLPPWSRLPKDDSAVGKLRIEATKVGDGSRLGRAVATAHGLYWPVKATVDATVQVLRYGKHARAVSGMRRRDQWREALRLAHTMNYSPKTYYGYRFWDPDVRPRATRYLQIDEMTIIQFQIIDDATVIDDKERFEAACAEHNLARPTSVSILGGRRSERWWGTADRLPSEDLFVKPVNGKQGRGAELWTYDGATSRWRRRGVEVDHDALLGRIRKKRRAVIVQLALVNHPDIARLSPTALSTFRVMTSCAPEGRAEVIAVVLKVARVGSEVDNSVAGGMGCGVDVDTGRLGPVVSFDPSVMPQADHPDTGTRIEGTVLTTHRDVIELSLTAHEQLDVPQTVGWDVAMTPDGAVLVEGNPLWAISLYHLPFAQSLDDELATRLLDEVTATR